MNTNLFNTLQGQLHINSLNASIRHNKGYYETGCKQRFDLWYIAEGSMDYTYNQKHYKLNTGDLFLMYPNIVYEARVTSQHLDLIFSRFDFLIGSSEKLLLNFPLDGHIQSDDYIHTELYTYLNLFLNSFSKLKSHEFLIDFISKQHFSVLIASLIKHQLSKLNSQVYEDKTYVTSKFNTLAPVLTYISQSNYKTISNSRLASIVGMSEKYFITYFKSILGITPLQYQIEQKMQKAASLIKSQQLTVKEVSLMLGYKDQYNFSTAFKKHFGISPSFYLDGGK